MYNYTFEVSLNGYVLKTFVLRAEDEMQAYEKAYMRTPDGCRIELVEATPAVKKIAA